MTTKDHSTSPDEQKIKQLYQLGAIEKPSSLLDQKVLKQAKVVLADMERNTKYEQAIRPIAWRKWQWSGSIAASVLLVSWLFMFNQPYYHELDLVTDEQYIESKVAAKAQSEEAKRERQLQTKPQRKIVARSEKNADDIVHSASAEKVEHSSLNGSPASDEHTSFVNKEKDLAERSTITSDSALPMSALNKFTAETSADTISPLAKTTDKPSPDYPYLDTLLQQILYYRQKMNLNQSNRHATEPATLSQTTVQVENESSKSAQKAQVEMFELLHKYKKHDPTWLVPQKYLIVLSQDQLHELMKASDVELPE